MDFQEFRKIPRLSRDIVITEKIDGTNGVIGIGEAGEFFVGSRSRWLSPETGDNHGFLLWAFAHKEELLGLGSGYHFGEWWGLGIQRGYNLKEKRFSLFNVHRWSDEAVRPACCSVVPVLYRGEFHTSKVYEAILELKENGSKASPGYDKPEGVVIFHTASNYLFKKTILGDEYHKGES